MAQNIYREWFVNFRFPGHENVKMVDSPMGKIPEGWEPTHVEKVVALVSRGASLVYTENGGIPVLNQRCIREGEISLEAVQYAMPLSEKKHYLYLRRFDILINSMGVGTLGRVSRNISIYEKMIIHNCITVVRANPERASNLYMYYCLRDCQAYLESLGVGTTGQTSLRIDSILEIPLLLPTQVLLKLFSSLIFPIWEQIGNLKRRTNILRQTSDLLLPKLISGEVDVSELDITIPEDNA